VTALRSLAVCVGVVVVALALVVQPAPAGLVLDFTDGETRFRPDPGETLGWEFTVSSPITVDALGLFDVGANGLGDPHFIGLWTLGGTLLASTTIDTANSTPVASTSALGNWRFTPITPLILAAGEYVIGATYGTNSTNSTDFLVAFANASTVPGVTFDQARFLGFGGGFPAVAAPPFNDGFFGPNLSVVAAEPASLVLLGAGLAGLSGLAAWRARRRQ